MTYSAHCIMAGMILAFTTVPVGASTQGQNGNSTDQKSKPELTSPMKSLSVTPKDPHFSIHLKANPTTGYQWMIRQHSDAIVPLGSEYHAPKNTMPGAGGYSSWHFKVKKHAFAAPQELSVTLVYKRPWKAKGGEVKRFVIHTQTHDEQQGSQQNEKQAHGSAS